VDELAGMFSCVTGWDVSSAGLLEVSERVINLLRLFNLREGFTAADDILHQRACAVPAFGKHAGGAACGIPDYPGMLKEYYEARGWDSVTGGSYGRDTQADWSEINTTACRSGRKQQ
jgi:aldehyde:ferredoxin oxidoreductase